MKLFTLNSKLWLPRPLDEVFPFFADARNLETLTPPWLRFEVLTPGPVTMAAGARIDYRLRLRGIPIRWQSEITAWEPPYRFIDEQVVGPYRLWIHEHRFTEKNGNTLAEDSVRYASTGVRSSTACWWPATCGGSLRIAASKCKASLEIWPRIRVHLTEGTSGPSVNSVPRVLSFTDQKENGQAMGQIASGQQTYKLGLTTSAPRPAAVTHWKAPRDSRNDESPGAYTENVERRLIRVESILVLITVAAIAYGDYLVGTDTSLGYLYLIPLSYSALTQKLRTTMGLLLVCVVLRQWFGPLERSTWAFFIRDWALTGIFALVATTIYRLGQQRHRLFETSRKQRDELLREVELAAQVQSNLLSKNAPPTMDCDIAAHMSPAKVVGGDYYDFIPLEDGRTSIVIADVAGKGLPAALLMPAVQIALRALVTRYDRTEDILQELNTALYETIQNTSYATLFYGTLDAGSTCIRYTNAGHLPALLLRADTHEARWLGTGGHPVGMLPDAAYETEAVALHPGDILLLYTDGVTEAENRLGEQFGRERLPSIVLANWRASSAEIVEAVRHAVEDFQDGRPQDDDLTLIAVRIPGQAHRSENKA